MQVNMFKLFGLLYLFFIFGYLIFLIIKLFHKNKMKIFHVKNMHPYPMVVNCNVVELILLRIYSLVLETLLNRSSMSKNSFNTSICFTMILSAVS
jgi:hypothetical protein